MTRRTLGIALMVFGGILAVAGLAEWVTAGMSAVTADPTTTLAEGASTTATADAKPSTTKPASTTSTLGPTTTTIDPVTAIEAFVVEFADAIDRGDADFLFTTLHPAVLVIFDEGLCVDFIEAEILLLQNYRLTDQVTGPTTQSVATFSVDMFMGPVAFVLQGQDFEVSASFALEDNQVRWFTECRPDA